MRPLLAAFVLLTCGSRSFAQTGRYIGASLDAPFSVNLPGGLWETIPYVYIKANYDLAPESKDPKLDLQVFTFDVEKGWVTGANSWDGPAHMSVTSLDSETVAI